MTREEAIKIFNEVLLFGKARCTQAEFEELAKMSIKALEQEPLSDKYEYHIDHTDCIWYGNDSGCPVTCSQYRDGWNDAMEYIFKGGKGYQPYRREE